VYGFALVISVAVGLCIGALIALLAERLSRRSIRVVEAEHITGRVKDGHGE
jgi:NhaP-type Na+/H+ or K+/H+ antiporter